MNSQGADVGGDATSDDAGSTGVPGGRLTGLGGPAVSDAEAEREVLTWDVFGSAVRQLAQQVVDSGFVPDLVLGIARGGLPIAGGLAYALGAKAVGTLNVEFYTGIGATLDEPVVLPPLLDMDAVTGSTVLVVDDVSDSGRTLELVLRLVRERVAAARTAVIYQKPRSVIRPDYAWRHTDRWIVFPWSAEPPVTRRA